MNKPKAKRKILIVSNHFPPLNTMASKRYGYMCKYFEDNGYEPYILTARPRSGGYLDAKLDLEVPIASSHIIRMGDLGIVYPINNPWKNLLIHEYKCHNIRSRIVDEEAIGWYEKIKEEIDIRKFLDFDLVLGTFPFIGNLMTAYYIAKKIKKPFVIEIRDLMSDYTEGFDRSGLERKFELMREQRILRKADGIVAVTEGFNKILRKRYPTKKIVTVYNGWKDNDICIKNQDKENYIYYAGALYEHRVESLRLLFETIKKYNIDIGVKIRSLGPEILNDKLRGFIDEFNLQEKVELLNAASEKVVREEQSRAKINLLVSSLNPSDQALMATLPGKLFELMRLDSAILAIVDETSEVSGILNYTGKGKALSSAEAICRFVCDEYIKYQGYREKVNNYSRRRQAAKLCSFLDTVVGGVE